MTDEPHPWEKLREAQTELDIYEDALIIRRIDAIMDNARVFADELFSSGKPAVHLWHDAAIAYVREQLKRSPANLNQALLDWFAQHGVTP
jgi:hypothetical protein